MSAKTVNADLDSGFRNGAMTEKDPGDAGVIGIENKGLAICEVVTAGAETRVLESATHFGVGQMLLVVLKTDGGDLTVDSDAADVVMTDAGDMALFQVTDVNGVKAWRVMSNSRAQAKIDNFVTSAPVAVTGANDGSSGANAAVTSLLAALVTLGLITDGTS